MKRIILRSVILIFFLTFIFVNHQTLFKSDNSTYSSSSSASLTSILDISGTKSSNPYTADSYAFTVSVDGAYTINNSFNQNPSYPMSYTVTNSSGDVLIPSNGYISTPVTQMLNADTYNLNIYGEGDYNVSIVKAPDGVIPANAITLPLNTLSNEKMPSWSYYQNIYYTINLPFYAHYKFFQNYPGTGNLSVTINPGNTHPLLFSDYTQHSVDQLLSAGNYTIDVHKTSYSGPFNFSVELIPNNPYYVIDSATPISIGTPVIGTTSNTNIFNLTIPTSGSYTVNLTAEQATTTWFYIFNNTYDLIGNVTSYSYPEQLIINLKASYYYIQLYDISGSGSFSLEVSSNNPVTHSSTTTTTTTTSKTSNSSSVGSSNTSSSPPSTTSSNPISFTSESSSKKSKISPFSSLDIIIISIIIISSVSLIKRRRS